MGNRRRHRGGAGEHCLFEPINVGKPTRLLRRISKAQGDAMVRAKTAIRHDHPETYVILGYELMRDGKQHKPRPVSERFKSVDLSTDAALTVHEEELAIGILGSSRTEGLLPELRLQRVLNGLPEYDEVELARVKVAAHAPRYRA